MGGIIRVKERLVQQLLQCHLYLLGGIYISGKIVNHLCRAPLLGGQFAAWGICFSSFDCTFAHIRGKEVHLGFLVLELILDLFSSSGSLEFHHVWSSCRGSDGC